MRSIGIKRILWTSVIYLSTVAFCFSQNSYPSKIVLAGDTLVVITTIQLKQINLKLVERNMYIDMINDTKTLFTDLNSDIVKVNKLLNDKTNLTVLQDAQIKDLNRVIYNYSQNVGLLKTEITRQKRKRIKSIIVSVAASAIVTSTGVLLLKN